MRLKEVSAGPDWMLSIRSDDGRFGSFDVRPHLQFEAFHPLHDPGEFAKVMNGGYFIEWACGTDLSVDTIEAHWRMDDKDGRACKSIQETQMLNRNSLASGIDVITGARP